MPRGRILVWTIIGAIVGAAALAAVLTHVDSGTSPNAASSPVPSTSAGASSQAASSAPVVTPPAAGAVSYLADLHPTGNLAELVVPGPVTITGSIYPKSISFYCNVGDPTPFPVYTVRRRARRFQATIGLAPGSPAQFQAGVILLGDGRTLRTLSVSVRNPTTVDVDVKGVKSLRLECFGSGNSATGGEAVPIVWGNARISGGP